MSARGPAAAQTQVDDDMMGTEIQLPLRASAKRIKREDADLKQDNRLSPRQRGYGRQQLQNLYQQYYSQPYDELQNIRYDPDKERRKQKKQQFFNQYGVPYGGRGDREKQIRAVLAGDHLDWVPDDAVADSRYRQKCAEAVRRSRIFNQPPQRPLSPRQIAQKELWANANAARGANFRYTPQQRSAIGAEVNERLQRMFPPGKRPSPKARRDAARAKYNNVEFPPPTQQPAGGWYSSPRRANARKNLPYYPEDIKTLLSKLPPPLERSP